jgi:hypothetical protein
VGFSNRLGGTEKEKSGTEGEKKVWCKG